jgi:[ribosomal protein S5]-alanine N-acetyltransferase
MEPFAETERLLLREILPEDEAALFELDSDPEVHRYVGKRPVETLEQIKMVIAFIRQQYSDNGIGRWAVVEKSSGQFIGWAGLKLFTDEVNGIKDFYELGYRFMKKHWGKGYATEAAKAILAYGFEELELTAIYGMTDPENTASKKVLEKAGLKYVETFDFAGEPTDWFVITTT